MTRILIAEPERFSSRAAEILAGCGDVELRAISSDELPEVFERYDVVWMRLAHVVDANTLGPSPRCRVLATPVTGLDRIDLDACQRRGVRVVSLKGESEFLREVRATAEHTLALLFALLRKIPDASASVREGRWERDLFPGAELYRKTVGLVGVGRLGSLVAEYLRVLGARVIGFDPRPDFPVDVAQRADSLRELAEASDVVSVHAVYETSTRHLLDGAFFAAMKPGAVLVNTARGGIVDEAALLAAVRSGHVAGAGFDVFDIEPPQPDHPFFAEPRILLTPHSAGMSLEATKRSAYQTVENILATFDGTLDPAVVVNQEVLQGTARRDRTR